MLVSHHFMFNTTAMIKVIRYSTHHLKEIPDGNQTKYLNGAPSKAELMNLMELIFSKELSNLTNMTSDENKPSFIKRNYLLVYKIATLIMTGTSRKLIHQAEQ
ncbi:CLUMA_CG003335, isoform A [Clunio marinus]|uniref:CLUMA_CG003335, isoform A n=1 Tax=Clunio marinus TaxID=568069 RepID=A0A1J1HND1_9DIPT|nr:CLUMA_CG003335, isoform A [Clunio marinus]